MDALKEHTIAFSGLKDGAHAFQFQLGEAFFSAAGEEEMEGGEVLVDVALDKSTTLLVVDLHAKGTVDLRCDHCNAPLAFALEGSQKQIFRLTGEEQYDDGELVSLEAGAHSVNLTHYIYECLRLALPIRHVHAPGECDPEVEQVLERLRVAQEPMPDPRWGVLDQLKNQQP
jgi:uncharacterized protein